MSKIFDEFRSGKFAVNCRTENEARQFVKLCFENKICWSTRDGDDITEYDIYEEDTYYAAYGDNLCYGSIDINIPNYKVITFKEFMKALTNEEESKMCSNGKLNKGIESVLVQDTYRAVQKPNGSIEFNKVKMVNLCFVKFDGLDKIYTFINPTDKRLEEGTKVLVDSAGRNSVAYVVSSIKIQNKYVKELMYAMSGKKGLELKNVLGILETKEILHKFGE